MGSSVTAITASPIRCGEEHGRYGLQLGVLYRPRGQHEWSKDRLAAKTTGLGGSLNAALPAWNWRVGLLHQTERNPCGARKTHWTLLMFPRSRRRLHDLARRPDHKPLTLQNGSLAGRRFVSGAVAACRDWPAIPGIRGRAQGLLPAGHSPAPQARTAWHSTPRARQARCGRPNPAPP